MILEKDDPGPFVRSGGRPNGLAGDLVVMKAA